MTSKKAIILMLLCTFFTSLGQILWKYGLKDFSVIPLFTVSHFFFALGFVSYGIGALLMIWAFRQGELSVLYPIAATSFVWISVASPFIFPTDVMNSWKWAGVILILVSISVLGWASSQVNHHD